jgi:excinuclease UvrABC nuclease subunit
MTQWAAMFDERWEATPPISDEAFAAIPAKRGLLLLVSDRDQPIIMLTAGDLRARLRTRLAEDDAETASRRTDLRQITRAVLWKLTTSHFETDLTFLELIRKVWPKQYRSMISWKRPWFVHIDPGGDFPHFVRTRAILEQEGRYVGPFPSAKAADGFVQVLQDVFCLCREPKHLRLAPNGSQCSYGQMGRCLSPCDGSISMADYGDVITRAADAAAGDRNPIREELTQEMADAAAALAFEKAASIKGRLGRLAELDSADCELAAPIEQFQYLLVQRGPNARTARTYFVNGPAVVAGKELAYPLAGKQLTQTISKMAAFVAREPKLDEAGPWRMGVVAHYLFAGDSRRGVALRWRPDLTADELGAAIEEASDDLKLRAPKRKAKDSTGS